MNGKSHAFILICALCLPFTYASSSTLNGYMIPPEFGGDGVCYETESAAIYTYGNASICARYGGNCPSAEYYLSSGGGLRYKCWAGLNCTGYVKGDYSGGQPEGWNWRESIISENTDNLTPCEITVNKPCSTVVITHHIDNRPESSLCRDNCLIYHRSYSELPSLTIAEPDGTAQSIYYSPLQPYDYSDNWIDWLTDLPTHCLNSYSAPPSALPSYDDAPEFDDPDAPDAPPTVEIEIKGETELSFNKQQLNVLDIPDTGCKTLSGGGVVCNTGYTPPLGTDGRVDYDYSGQFGFGDETYRYYTPRPHTGLTGEGQTDNSHPESQRIVGGDGCETKPICSDPTSIECFSAIQAWETKCLLVLPEIPELEVVDFGEVFEIDDSGYTKGSCPPPKEITILGHRIDFSYNPYCDLAAFLAPYLKALTYVFIALFVVRVL